MWLVFTSANDPLAPWLADGLRRRTDGPVVPLHPDELSRAQPLHDPTAAGRGYFILQTHDGQEIDSRDVTGVLNRLVTAAAGALTRPDPAGRDDRSAADSPLLERCLRMLDCPVLNPPPGPPCRELRLDFEWASFALQAGLRCPARPPAVVDFSLRRSRHACPADGETARVLVVDRATIVPPDVVLPFRVLEACRRLAQLAHTPLLGVDLFRLPHGNWYFAGADTAPDPSSFGPAALDALADAFTIRPRGARFFIRSALPRVCAPSVPHVVLQPS